MPSDSRAPEGFFESLVEVSPVAIVIMDADERVTSWNPAAAELFGWSSEEAIGRPIDDLVSERRTSAEKAGSSPARRSTEGVPSAITRRVRRDGGAGRRADDARAAHGRR